MAWSDVRSRPERAVACAVTRGGWGAVAGGIGLAALSGPCLAEVAGIARVGLDPRTGMPVTRQACPEPGCPGDCPARPARA